jgi:hypothetical protein
MGLLSMMGMPPGQDQQDQVDAKRLASDMEPVFKALKVIQRQLDAKPHLTPLVETFHKQLSRGRGKSTKGSNGNGDGAQPAPLVGSTTPMPPMMSGQNTPPAPQPRPFPGAI